MPLISLFKDLSLQALATLFLGLVTSTLLFFAIGNLESDRVNFDFQRRADQRISAIRDGLQDAVNELAVVNRLFAVAGIVSPDQFKIFVSPMLDRLPHIQNFAMHRLISHGERFSFETRMQLQHPGFRIKQVINGQLLPVRSMNQYRVIEYVEPLRANEASLGLETSTRASQRDAALRACRTGLVSITEPYPLVQNNLKFVGLVMLAPVYRMSADLDNTESRCNEVIAYTSAVFNAENLVKQTLMKRKLLGGDGYAVTVHTGDASMAANLVFRSEDSEFFTDAKASFMDKIYDDTSRNHSSNFEVAGRQWHVVVSSIRLPIIKNHFASLVTLISGILFSFFAAAYLQSQVKRAKRDYEQMVERAEKKVRDQTLYQTNCRLLSERERLRTLFNQAPSFVAVLNGPEHVFEIANSAFYKLVGLRDLIGLPIKEALPEFVDQWFFDLLDTVYKTGEAYVGKNLQLLSPEQFDTIDEVRYIDFVLQPILDADGKVSAIFVQGNDISVQTKTQRELDRMIGQDALTGLPNGNLMAALLNQMTVVAKRDGHSVIVLMLDLDGFKAASENFGHAASNEILKTIATRLISATHNDGMVGRLGGDKFLLIFPQNDSQDNYHSIVQRIRMAIGGKIKMGDHDLFMTCSLGVSIYPIDAYTPDTLIQCADIAMYGAKKLGPNNFQLYTPQQNERVRERLKLEAALRNALICSEFVLHYQPQVDLRTGEIVALEALIRWQHPELGLISPDVFIAIAEETGLILPIGEWALRSACVQMKAWQNASLGNLRVAVNISALQFADSDLITVVCDVLEKSGLDPKYLDLELTESSVMKDVNQTVRLLTELGDLGVQLSIDDFGTGYSSLSYLKQFPIDVLKIDRSFIREVPENTNDSAIADAIISLAHSLDMKVVAEGVETEEQCEFLTSKLCDEMQGFLFSKALPVQEIELLLRDVRALPKHLLRMH